MLADPLLKKNPHVSFRCSQARTSLQLDHRPTLHSVREFVKVVQSEFDMLSLAAPSDSNKKPKLAAVQQQGTDGGGNKGKDTGGKGGEGKGKRKGNDQALESGTDAAKTEAKASGKSEGKPCSFYLTTKGCSKGRQCGVVHQYGKAKGESRCYNCGSTEHRQNDCTRPTGGGKPRGSVQGKGKGSKGSSSSTPAGSLGVGGDAADSSNFTNPYPLAAKVSADGGVATPGGVPGNKGVSQPPQNQTQNVANAHAQVLEEAQKRARNEVRGTIMCASVFP